MTASPLTDVERLLAEEPFLRSLARTLVGEEADEIVQQTWLQALGHRGVPVLEPRHWLARIARNVAHNLRRSRARRTAHEREVAAVECVPSSAVLLEREERRRSLVFAVDRLPGPLRTVVLLRYFDNLQPREIAEKLGVTVAAVSNRLLRALELLRQRLDAEHGGDRRAWLMPLVQFAAGRPGAAGAMGATTAGVLLMTIQTKLLTAVGILLLAGLALWAVSDSWSAVPAGPDRSLPAASASSVDLPNNRAVAQPADVVQRSPVVPAVAVPDKTALLVHAVYGNDRSPATDLLLLVRRDEHDTWFEARRARTDAQGNARFEGLAAGRVRVLDGHLSSGIRADIKTGEVTETEFALRPGIDITGIVVDREGLPVPGAEVYLAFAGSTGTEAQHATTADTGGRFTLRCCGNPIMVVARAHGHAPSMPQFLFDEKGTRRFEVRIELSGPGGAVEGTVVGPDGGPVADAAVRIGAGRIDLVLSYNGAPPLPAQVRTDREGHYRAVGLPEGEQPVVVRAAGLAPWTGTCQVAANVVTALPVALGAGVTVKGTVRASDGAPVPKASVTVGNEGDLAFYRTRSGADGAFLVEGLRPGEFQLAAVDEELGKASINLRGSAGETVPCEVRLSLGIVLRGRLLTENDEVVANGSVYATAEAGNGAARWETGTSVDADGRFAIDNCPDGRLLGIEARGEGVTNLRLQRVDPRAGELVLRAKKTKPLPPPSARIAGTLVLADGKPAAGIMVHVKTTGGGFLYITDENGHFEFGPLVPGMARVDVDADKLPLFRSERELAADATWDLGTVRLVGGTILARFDGKVEGLRMLLCDLQGEWVTNIDAGTVPFRSRPMVTGSYQLLVSSPEIAAMTLPAEVRENEESVVDVRPQRGVAQKIEFTSAGGWQNAAWLDVAILRGSDLILRTTVTTGSETSPTLACRLVPGSYTVTAKGEGVAGRAEFTVVEGAAEAIVRVAMH
jgi:RNA polymerase sigma factor (sigma-70 family)